MTATSGRVSSRRVDVHTHAMPNDAVAQVAATGFRPTGGYKISVVWSPEAALAYCSCFPASLMAASTLSRISRRFIALTRPESRYR
jgi:hypothetical protein